MDWVINQTTSYIILCIDNWNRGELHAYDQNTINEMIDELRKRFPS